MLFAVLVLLTVGLSIQGFHHETVTFKLPCDGSF